MNPNTFMFSDLVVALLESLHLRTLQVSCISRVLGAGLVAGFNKMKEAGKISVRVQCVLRQQQAIQ